MEWLRDRFRYAFAGFRYGMLQDKSIRFQGIIGALVILAGIWLELGKDECLWISLAVTLVIVCEIFNSCIEKTIDYISLERNRQAGLIKDMAASAVLAASLFALLCALLIMLPKLISRFQG